MRKIYICLAVTLIFADIQASPRGEAEISSASPGTGQAATGKEPLTLLECYDLALNQSETIGINKETIKEAEAHFTQFFGTILPHLSFSYTYNKLDQNNLGASYPGHSYAENFVVSQTLFSGFKELAGMSGSRKEIQQRIKEKSRAEQLLLTDVANAFYLLIELKEALRALEGTKSALADRINELKQRERLGRSRRSEVVNAETQLYNVAATIELDKRQISLARQLLEFLTGQSIGDLKDTDFVIGALSPKNEYVAKLMRRPDVQAAEQAWNVAKQQAVIARSYLFPTVTVQGDYYTARTTQPQDSKWDAVLSVNVPIFEGTETYGSIKEANAAARASGLTFRQTKRAAIQDIEDSYEKMQTGIARTAALKKALAAAKMNYKLQKRDYQLNLMSNLDVLQAIQTLEAAKLEYIHALYDTKRLYWQLLASTGEATRERLNDAF